MKRLIYSVLTVLASLAMVGSLQAASEFTEQARGTTFNQNTELRSNNTDEIETDRNLISANLSGTQSAENLLGLNVVAQDGENIGEIQDFKVDTRTGRIDYVIVERENAMGIGEDIAVAVPLGALQFTDDNARLVVDKSKLDNVPSPATMSDREFYDNLNTHYGIAPGWQEERKIIHHEETKRVKPAE